MSRYRPRKTECPRDPARLMRSLRSIRDMLINDINHVVAPFGPTFKMSSAVIREIDALGNHISGEKDYFVFHGGAGSSQGHVDAWRDKMARERGELPWS